jgi:hypothetical protein
MLLKVTLQLSCGNEGVDERLLSWVANESLSSVTVEL